MDEAFGSRLKKAMAEKGLSASELSRISGVGKSDISNYINGKYLAKQDKVFALAKALGVDPGWLMTGVEPEPEPEAVPIVIPDSAMFAEIMNHMTSEDYDTVMAIFTRTYARMRERGEA